MRNGDDVTMRFELLADCVEARGRSIYGNDLARHARLSEIDRARVQIYIEMAECIRDVAGQAHDADAEERPASPKRIPKAKRAQPRHDMVAAGLAQTESAPAENEIEP